MALGQRRDPFPSFNFAVEIAGVTAGGFSEVSGLQAESEITEYREGGVNEYTHKRAGPMKYTSNLTLKHGITDSAALWAWYCDVLNGVIERKNVSVMLMNSAGEEKRRWNFRGAYPVKWTGPELRANNSEVAAESLELAHNGLASGLMPPELSLSLSVAAPELSLSVSVTAPAINLSAGLTID